MVFTRDSIYARDVVLGTRTRTRSRGTCILRYLGAGHLVAAVYSRRRLVAGHLVAAPISRRTVIDRMRR